MFSLIVFIGEFVEALKSKEVSGWGVYAQNACLCETQRVQAKSILFASCYLVAAELRHRHSAACAMGSEMFMKKSRSKGTQVAHCAAPFVIGEEP